MSFQLMTPERISMSFDTAIRLHDVTYDRRLKGEILIIAKKVPTYR